MKEFKQFIKEQRSNYELDLRKGEKPVSGWWGSAVVILADGTRGTVIDAELNGRDSWILSVKLPNRKIIKVYSTNGKVSL